MFFCRILLTKRTVNGPLFFRQKLLRFEPGYPVKEKVTDHYGSLGEWEYGSMGVWKYGSMGISIKALRFAPYALSFILDYQETKPVKPALKIKWRGRSCYVLYSTIRE